MYVGGTANIKEQTEGKSSTANQTAFVFESLLSKTGQGLMSALEAEGFGS
jgi:hypothetical protein